MVQKQVTQRKPDDSEPIRLTPHYLRRLSEIKTLDAASANEVVKWQTTLQNDPSAFLVGSKGVKLLGGKARHWLSVGKVRFAIDEAGTGLEFFDFVFLHDMR